MSSFSSPSESTEDSTLMSILSPATMMSANSISSNSETKIDLSEDRVGANQDSGHHQDSGQQEMMPMISVAKVQRPSSILKKPAGHKRSCSAGK